MAQAETAVPVAESPAWAEGLRGLERIRSTDVAGLVLCQYRPSGKKPRCYVITHEASGVALTQNANNAAGVRLLKVANSIVRVLGGLQHRRRSVDWTQPLETLNKISVVSHQLAVMNGWVSLTDKRSIDEQYAEIDTFRRQVGLPQRRQLTGAGDSRD